MSTTAPPPEAAPSEKKPRAKREMTPEALERLRLAREKALATRRDTKLLKEREALIEKETIEARWEKLHQEEERLKKIRPQAVADVPIKKKSPKSKIIHLSPPLSSESEETSSESEEEEYVPTNSRRALRERQLEESDHPPHPQPRSQPQPLPPASAEQMQLKLALKALGIRE
jgi:hypothetical protein